MSSRRRRAVVAAVALVALLAFVAGIRSGRPGSDPGGEAAAAAARPSGGPVRVVWGGDTTLGSAFGLPPDRGRPELQPVAPVLRAADVAAVNLEGTFAPGGGSKCARPDTTLPEGESAPVTTCYAFQAPPENATTLKRAGIDIVNTANNHAFDFGPLGWRGTRDALAAAKVRATGAPGEIRVLERNGTRIALLGFSTYPWTSGMSDDANVRTLVAAAARKAPVVIAFLHAGAEGNDATHVPESAEEAFGEDRGDSRHFAHVAVDAGADLVLGSGPHVLRGVEVYRDRLIAYSLGNLAGWDNFATGGASSLSALIAVRLAPDGRVLRGRITSLLLDGRGVPQRDGTGAAATQMRSLSAADFGAASAWRRGVLGAR